MAELSLRTLYRRYDKLLAGTGVVIAGYGEDDLFPGYREYRCYGLLLDVLVFDHSRSADVRIDSASVITPFATTAMVETFLLGFSPDVYDAVTTQFRDHVKALLKQVATDLAVDEIPNAATYLTNCGKSYTDAWTKLVRDAHWQPLREVVASLPIDEMADLAETLIMLQSLKEKVTAPTESVGGPIDVAVISRNEGLIWIKRKHYFDPSKNPRYFLRQRTYQ